MTLSSEIVLWLSENGFQAEAQALIPAAQQGRDDVLRYLLAKGVELKVLDAYGNNALWAACFGESLLCIDALLEAGIDIDYQNPSGATALIYAASSGKQSVVAHLLQAGADPLLTTQDDFSALDLAATRPCLQMLRQAVKLKNSE